MPLKHIETIFTELETVNLEERLTACDEVTLILYSRLSKSFESLELPLILLSNALK